MCCVEWRCYDGIVQNLIYRARVMVRRSFPHWRGVDDVLQCNVNCIAGMSSRSRESSKVFDNVDGVD